MKYLIQEPQQLCEALKKLYPDSSMSTLRDMLKNKRVSVDEKVVVKADFPVKVGQQICISSCSKPLPYGLQILYQDQSLIAINKPSGLLSVPLDEGNSPNAFNILRGHFCSSQIFAVHRLDQECSGVMLFARGKQSAKKFGKLFKIHDLKRGYFAVVEGIIENSGTWKSCLQESKNLSVYSDEGGKTAITHYKVIQNTKRFSFLELTLETGKKHQIRVHCKESGHPIVGDKRYGSSCNPVARLCLHAAYLEFIHPFTGKKINFSAPIPSAFFKLGVETLSRFS